MTTIFYVLAIAGALIAALMPLGALFGFFDGENKSGGYQFRTIHFTITILVVFLLSLGSVFVPVFGISDLISKASRVAELAVVKNRVQTLHTQDDLKAVFPSTFGDQTEQCYSAAISNYVQDQWAKSYYDESCKLGNGMCAHDEKEFFEHIRQIRNPNSMPLQDIALMGSMLGTIWLPAKDIYHTIKSFAGIIDPSRLGKPDIGTDASAYEEYRQYFVRCAGLHPEPWITPGDAIITSPAHLCLGACP